ncbi:hypothetical protein HYX18_01690 [Candidatus Woesearchaeota archaeon]|nr:hypothetical protein [Candidatus Woesearchaeota archaeon]
MDLNQIFLLLSKKGIDNVNLDMLLFEQRKEIYEKYADLFKEKKGRTPTYIVVKAYVKAKNLEKIKERLINELESSAIEKKFKYCYYCSLLLNNNEMASFFEQFILECADRNTDYNDFYFELKKEIETISNGNNKI